VMDLPAEFYLETVQHVFHRHSLPEGRMLHRGSLIRLGAIRRTALMTVEGKEDEITTPGQTHAAHGLLTGIPSGRKEHHLQEGAGHYGTFSGRRFREQIAPKIRAFFRTRRRSLSRRGDAASGGNPPRGTRPGTDGLAVRVDAEA
jgi:poly(3-hydroxybutyrate) depolymerase